MRGGCYRAIVRTQPRGKGGKKGNSFFYRWGCEFGGRLFFRTGPSINRTAFWLMMTSYRLIKRLKGVVTYLDSICPLPTGRSFAPLKIRTTPFFSQGIYSFILFFYTTLSRLLRQSTKHHKTTFQHPWTSFQHPRTSRILFHSCFHGLLACAEEGCNNRPKIKFRMKLQLDCGLFLHSLVSTRPILTRKTKDKISSG